MHRRALYDIEELRVTDGDTETVCSKGSAIVQIGVSNGRLLNVASQNLEVSRLKNQWDLPSRLIQMVLLIR